MTQETEKASKKAPNREIDYLKVARILLSRWYIIAATILAGLLLTSIYLWYTPKTYATSGILKFEEKKTELADLVNVVNNSGKAQVNLQSEKFIIQSRQLLLNAIKRLDYNISFYISGRVRRHDLYPNKPLEISLLKFDSSHFFQQPITFKPIDKSTFTLSWNMGDEEIKQTFHYHRPVRIYRTSFMIRYPGQLNSNTSYQFKFNTPETLLERVRNGLKTNEVVKNSNIVTIQQTDTNAQFAADILNAVMKEYLDYDRDQKTQSASQMIRFINEQQQYLSAAVKGSESTLEKYKQHSGILDISSSANQALSRLTELESQRSLLHIQLIAIDQLKKQISADKNTVNLNFNLEGATDPLLGILVTNLNNLLADKNNLLKTYNSGSQTIAALNNELTAVKAAALQNISASRQRIQKNIAYLNKQLAEANQQVTTLPSAEKTMISLRRDFEINEKVYSFLSEKKLEAQINRSAILPGATIIEQAQVDKTPISPNGGEIYRTSAIFGLLTGVGIILSARVFNPYIYDKASVESATTVPVIGVIRKFPEKIDEDNAQILALSKPRSIFAESVRSVRTNLNFLASEKQNKVICITSEVAGEGKSFVALNLSSTLALIDKKVILIGADLRRPKLHHAFRLPNTTGLSNYLVQQSSIADIIQTTAYKNLDFISSGPVPPNPAELLHHERIAALLDQLKTTYEVIMIDTAPIGLVSDAIPLIRQSDINLFIIRYGKSKHSSAHIPDGLKREYGLNNVAIVLNAFEETRLHSSYYKNSSNQGTLHYYADYNGYQSSGYYEDEEPAKWWQLKNWFKS